MSDKTPRFGLSFFGGAVPGSLSDDGNAFTLRDPVVEDRILAALEGHEHVGTHPGQQVPDPTGMPSLALLTGGTIGAGQTLYYVVTFVDRFGLESAAGDEIAIETAQVLLPPASPDAESAVGGTLSPGLYYYALTALDGEDETTLSAPEMATVIAGEGSVTLNLPDLPDGADSLRVWRQGPGEGTYSRLAIATDVTFTDNGSIPPDPCPWDPSHQPPSENTTKADGAVQVDLAPEDAAVVNDRSQQISSWRLYRSAVSGTYPAASLVTEMASHVSEDPTSDLVTTYIDDGATLQAGSPPPVSQTMREPSALALPTAATLPASTTGYPENYPLVVADKLYVVQGGTWVAISGGGGGAGGGLPQSAFTDPILTDASDGTRNRVTVVGGALALAATVLPGPPSVVVAAFDGTSALTWTAPAFDGGLAVAGYTVWLLSSAGGRASREVDAATLTLDLLASGLWNGAVDGWAWVSARNAQGYSQVDEGSIAVLTAAPAGPSYWSPATADDLFILGPTSYPPDAHLNWDTITAGMPVSPAWNDPGGTLHPMAGLRAAYYAYRPAQAGNITVVVGATAPPASGSWYVDLLTRPRDAADPVSGPTDPALVFQSTLFTGGAADTTSGDLVLTLDPTFDYYLAVVWPDNTGTGTIVITAGGYDWSALASPQVTTLGSPVLWHTREVQSGFGGWVLLDNTFDAGTYDWAFTFDDGTPLTVTLYTFPGAGYPPNVGALNEVTVLCTDQSADQTFTATLPAGRVWAHLEQAASGGGELIVSAG